MNQIEKSILQNPLIASIGIIFISVAFTFIPIAPLFQGILDEQSAEYMSGILEQTGMSIVLIFGMKRLNLLERGYFTKKVYAMKKAYFKEVGKSLYLAWPMLLLILLNVSDWLSGNVVIDWSSPLKIVLFILVYLSTGLFEETLCRGMVFNLMLDKWEKTRGGCYLALLLSSLLFGMAHFIHFFLGNASLLATVTQVTYATFIGVFFGAYVVRNKSIYPAIILHGIVDIAGSLNEIAVNGGIDKAYRTMSVEGAIVCVIIALPCLLYGLFLVRKEFRKNIKG